MDKQKLLAVLTGNKTLLGQHLSYHASEIEQGFADFVAPLSKRPAVLGIDYSRSTQTQLRTVNTFVLEKSAQGHIFIIDFMPDNPWTGGDCWDTTISERGLLELLDTDTQAGKAFLAAMSVVREALSALAQAGIAVIFRPLHEMTWKPTSFWWDVGTGGAEPYKELWRYVHTYFSNLDNLLWFYCTANAWEGVDPLVTYPGGEYVDLVGVDIYSDTAALRNKAGYQILLSTGKPFLIGECGPGLTTDGSLSVAELLKAATSKYPETCLIQFWHSWIDDEGEKMNIAFADQSDIEVALNLPQIVTLDEVEIPDTEPSSGILATLEQHITSLLETAGELRAMATTVENQILELTQLKESITALDDSLEALGDVIK